MNKIQLSSANAKTEDPYRIMFENNPLPMWVFDTDSLRFLMVNRAAVLLYGYSVDEFLQMTIKDIRPLHDLPALLHVTNSEREELNQAGEWRHIKKDGQHIYVEICSHVLPNVKGISRRLVVAHDITARKLAEKKLQEAKELTQAIVQNVVEIIFSINKKMDLTYVSHQSLGQLGYSPEQFYQDKWLWFKLVHPEDRHYFEDFLPDLLHSPKQLDVEFRMRTADGQIKWMRISCHATLGKYGRMKRVDGSASDITAKRKIEEQLRFADFSIERSVEAFLWTRSDGRIMRANDATCKLLKYTQEEIVQLKIFDISLRFHPAVWDEHWKEFREAKTKMFETKLKAKDGTIHPVEIRVNHFMFNGESYSFTSIREISERKRAEKEKSKLTEELVQQNENLQQFAYIVSHNLRAPVANVMGLIKLYNRNQPSDPVNGVLINKLEKTALRLDSTIKDLNEILTIRSQADQSLEIIDLQQVLWDVRDSITPQLVSCRSQFSIDFSAGSKVLGIKGYAHSIFLNLVTNAIKYRSPNRNLQIQVKSVLSDGFLCFHVQDNGLGINLEKEKQKVFGLYRRFHPHIEGKGLGLYMVKTQVETMGGRIEVESTPDIGSIFKIFFKYRREDE